MPAVEALTPRTPFLGYCENVSSSSSRQLIEAQSAFRRKGAMQGLRRSTVGMLGMQRARSAVVRGLASASARPPKSPHLHKRPSAPSASPAPAPRSKPPAPGPPGAPPAPGAPSTPAPAVAHPPKDVETAQPRKTETEPQRYGPLDVNLKPRDQLRPLLPTWNPPPTRRPEPEELEVSTRLRFLFEERWWAATVREAYETELRVGFDGWPSRHDQIVPRNSGRLYLHESVHPDYEARLSELCRFWRERGRERGREQGLPVALTQEQSKAKAE